MARMRRLLSQALSYSYDEGLIDYGIARERLPSPALQTETALRRFHSQHQLGLEELAGAILARAG